MLVILDTMKIKGLMQTKLISREELSERSGMSFDSVAHLFAGRFKMVQSGSLESLAGVFGVAPVELVGSPEAMKSRREELERTLEEGAGTPARIKRYKKEAGQLDNILRRYCI